ncbi:MAG TPA: GAF domain-containing protein, partial [Candidatus Limnocylindrales bacterium]|nr:GAF domain-containing protein [Candidatus Limnocylindrales bacterium]
MDLALQSAFLAEGSTLLILLAGAILLFRSFREKYLKAWIAGWTVFTLSRLFFALNLYGHYSSLWAEAAYGSFVIAMGLFAVALFQYTEQKRLIWPSVALISAAFIMALISGAQAAPAPALNLAVEICWRLVLLVAAVHLLRFAWGRPNPGRWLLAVMLVLPHLHLGKSPPPDIWHDFLVELLLGISMMTIVLDDSREQIRRLDVLNTITNQIAQSRDFEPTVTTVLQELTQTTRAKAAWFRVLEGEKLVIAAHRGLSEEFFAKARTIDTGRSVSGLAMRESEVYVMRSGEATPELSSLLKAEGVHHVVLVPVEGKNSQIGMLVLGMSGFRAYTENEKTFLKAAARQMGLAAENRKLAEQVVTSRNEWASTFDSLPDVILVHDADYRIIRANRALIRRLNVSREDVLDRPCEAVLPGSGVNWTGCPYCSHADHSGENDPCFGGYSVVSTSAYTGEGITGGGTVHVIKDVTEARAADERYSSLFNHMHEGVFASTPDGKIVDCN